MGKLVINQNLINKESAEKLVNLCPFNAIEYSDNKLDINSACKPFGFKIRKYIKKQGWDTKDIMFIGDQMITDVAAAKRAGLRVILTDKIVKEDQWTTHINRIFGRRIRKYHKKKGNLVDWRTIYGKGQ